jgi:hypothetical protein
LWLKKGFQRQDAKAAKKRKEELPENLSCPDLFRASPIDGRVKPGLDAIKELGVPWRSSRLCVEFFFCFQDIANKITSFPRKRESISTSVQTSLRPE